jgi:hypothetical protein
MSGSFVSFMAGILKYFRAITMHIVLTDSPVVRLLFQSEPELVTEFTFKDCTFHLVEYNLQEDKFVYVVSRGDFILLFFFYGIDASQPCGPSSNLDFVHFCWRHTIRISLNKYAPTLFCPTSNSEPTMLCLKYYRATADGWKDTSNCDSCFEQNQQLVRPYSYCKLPDECSCTICNRQPPSLHDIASHTLFNGRIQ